MAFESTSEYGDPQEERSGTVFDESGRLRTARTAPELTLSLPDAQVSG
jgi:hypothetical protein